MGSGRQLWISVSSRVLCPTTWLSSPIYSPSCLLQKSRVCLYCCFRDSEALVEEGCSLPVPQSDLHPESTKAPVREASTSQPQWGSRLWALVCFTAGNQPVKDRETTQVKRMTRVCNLFNRLSCLEGCSQLSQPTRESTVSGEGVSTSETAVSLSVSSVPGC